MDATFYRGDGPLVEARFVARPNRFLVIARVGRRLVRAASRDPGRLRELLVPGAAVFLAPSGDARRLTAYTLVLARRGRSLVSVVPALANDVLAAALSRGGVPGLLGARVLRREATRGRSRFDFVLQHRGVRILTEVKSATLVEDGVALFPDAPTARGVRHVRELLAHARRGGRAAVVFVVQRSDARAFEPYASNDPAFAAALRDAARAGVRVLAFTCRVTPRGVTLARRIPVRLQKRRGSGEASGGSPKRAGAALPRERHLK